MVVEWVREKTSRDFLGRLDIYEGFESILSAGELKMITAIGQQPSNNNWLVLFDKTFKVESLFGRNMTVRGRKASLLDPKVKRKPDDDALRFSWLPPNVRTDDIRLYLTNNKVKPDDIISIFKEKCKDEKIAHLSASTVLVKLKKQKEELIESLQGYHVMSGFKMCIERVGGPQKCFFCKLPGHYKKDCEKFKTRCAKCNGRGHTDVECNLAKRIQTANDDDETYEHDQEMNEQVSNEVPNNVPSDQQTWFDRQNSTSQVDSTTVDNLGGEITIGAIANEVHNQKEATGTPSSGQLKRNLPQTGATRADSNERNTKKLRTQQLDLHRSLNENQNGISTSESSPEKTMKTVST